MSRFWYMSRTVMITGLTHSCERASIGLGRYEAMFSKAGLPSMQTVSKVNSSPSMYSSQLASGTPRVACSAASSSARDRTA